MRPVVLLTCLCACQPTPPPAEDPGGDTVVALSTCAGGAAHPGARERCDPEGRDEDCDGLVNDDDPDVIGQRTWFPDQDGDGHGAAEGGVLSCEAPLGFVSTSDDCQDDDAAIHPDATELCNGQDDDCDPTTSEVGMITVDGAESADDLAQAVSQASSSVTVCGGSWPGGLLVERSLALIGVDGARIEGDGEGPLIEVSAGSLHVEGFTLSAGGGVTDDEGVRRGGAIMARDADELTVESCVITDSQADYGGAIYGPSAGDTVLLDCTVQDNSATASGGGIYGSSVQAESVEISGNVATYGGGVFASHGVLSLLDTVVEANQAERGGGLYLKDSVLQGGTFQDNLASARGGGIYIRDGGDVLDATVQDNQATDYGGGLIIYGGALLQRLDISGNLASTGGGLLVDSDGLELEQVSLSDNQVTGAGGGAYVYGCDAQLSETSVVGNLAAYGGGFFVQDGALLGDGSSTITSNQGTYGGGVYIGSGGAELEDLRLSANTAEEDGGGVASAGSSSLYRVQLESNQAADSGGGMHTGADADLDQVELLTNDADYGGGLYVTGGASVTLSDAEVSGNIAVNYGGGARLIDGTLSSQQTGWGEGSDDNDPDDLYVGDGGVFSGLGAAESFECDSEAAVCE